MTKCNHKEYSNNLWILSCWEDFIFLKIIYQKKLPIIQNDENRRTFWLCPFFAEILRFFSVKTFFCSFLQLSSCPRSGVPTARDVTSKGSGKFDFYGITHTNVYSAVIPSFTQHIGLNWQKIVHRFNEKNLQKCLENNFSWF